MVDVEKRLALLIDADNAPASKIDEILAEFASHGAANVRRAYGDWQNPRLKGWVQVLQDYAIRPMQQFAYSKGKNASDMALVVDAMDLLYAGTLDAFAIVSSDADFTPLVMRLRTEGMKVYGFGERKTPAAFVNACSKFTYLEALGQPAAADAADAVASVAAPPGGVSAPAPRKGAAELRQDARLVRMLRNAIASAAEGDDGWANLSAVGSQMGNQASFDPRNYGYAKLSGLVDAIGLFEVRKDGKAVSVRLPPKSGATAAVAKPASALKPAKAAKAAKKA